jgi:hypothetical protein
VNPRAIVQLEGLGKLKKSTSSDILEFVWKQVLDNFTSEGKFFSL